MVYMSPIIGAGDWVLDSVGWKFESRIGLCFKMVLELVFHQVSGIQNNKKYCMSIHASEQ